MAPLLALAALALLSTASADWSEAYSFPESFEFTGYACVPTTVELSNGRSPRADIMGVEALATDAYLEVGYMSQRYQDFDFTGGDNQFTDPREVEGSPYATTILGIGTGEFDSQSVVSLGKAGWFRGRFAEVVSNGAGDDLAVYESDYLTTNPQSGAANTGEPFCVYGSLNENGPFAFIGYHKVDTEGGPGGTFELAGSYQRFSGQTQIQYIVVMDSGDPELILGPSFSYAPEEPLSLNDVVFTDETNLQGFAIVQRTWDFGDGTILQAPAATTATHAYARSGTYTVCLTLTEADGATGTECQDIVAANRPPVAKIVTSPEVPEIGQAVTFDAKGSTDPDGTLRSVYKWDFGDGTSILGGPTIQHRYMQKGAYEASVTVTDNHGATGSISKTVATTNDPPTAVITILQDSDTVDNPVRVSAESSTDPDGDELSYFWDFGDGTTSIERIVEHAYGERGTYVVTLTVDDGYGGSDQVTHSFDILWLPPMASFEAPTTVRTYEDATFQDTSAKGDHELVVRKWDVGNGRAEGPATLSHLYKVPGVYEVTLYVEDSNRGYAEQTRIVVV